MPATDELRRNLEGLRMTRGNTAAAARTGRSWRLPAIVVALVLLLVVGRQLRSADAPRVEVADASVLAAGNDGAPVLSGAGYVVSGDRYISIGVRVAGRVERYRVEEGDRVQKGDPLVHIDPRDYQAAVERLTALVTQTKATATLKRRQATRARALAGSGVIARDELDVRDAEAQVAEAAVGQAQAELTSAQVALEYTTLYAPRSGVILAKLKEVGEIAVPGGFSGSGDLIRMANLEDLRGQVDVTEAELSKVSIGQRAHVVPDAYPDRTYAARVVKLYPQVDRQKGTLRVEVHIENPDERLWPDMSVRITFLQPVESSGPGGAVLVPRAAVRNEGSDVVVFTVVDGKARRRVIATGPTLGERVQVLRGLDGTESVVVNDVALADGVAVSSGTER